MYKIVPQTFIDLLTKKIKAVQKKEKVAGGKIYPLNDTQQLIVYYHDDIVQYRISNINNVDDIIEYNNIMDILDNTPVNLPDAQTDFFSLDCTYPPPITAPQLFDCFLYTQTNLNKLTQYYIIDLTTSKHIQTITNGNIEHIVKLHPSNLDKSININSIIAGNQKSIRIATPEEFLVKSVIIDIGNNFVESIPFVGLRSIDFYDYENSKILLNSPDITAYATSTLPSSMPAFYPDMYSPKNVFLTGLSKKDSWQNTSWISNNTPTNQRLIGVFTHPQPIYSIKINNAYSHEANINTNKYYANSGAKHIKIYFSPEEITNTLYNAQLDNCLKVFEGNLRPHILVNSADDQTVLNRKTNYQTSFDLTLEPNRYYLELWGYDTTGNIKIDYKDDCISTPERPFMYDPDRIDAFGNMKPVDEAAGLEQG